MKRSLKINLLFISTFPSVFRKGWHQRHLPLHQRGCQRAIVQRILRGHRGDRGALLLRQRGPRWRLLPALWEDTLSGNIYCWYRAVVPTPEICSSYPVAGNFIEHILYYLKAVSKRRKRPHRRNKHLCWSVVRAIRMKTGTKLAKWSLPTPEVCGSNPIIGKVYIEYCLLSTVLKRRK